MPKQSIVIRMNVLLNETVKIITRNSHNYIAFLKGVAPSYKYNFTEQLLIYAQNPMATAVATMETWNRIGLWVNQNAPKIDIFLNGRLYSLYDIADVNSREGKRAYVWQMKDEYESQVLKNLSERFNIQEIETLADAFPIAIESAIAEQGLSNTPYFDLLRRSCNIVVSTRCGHAVWTASRDYLSDISAYSNQIMDLGTDINSVVKAVLEPIERTVRAMDAESKVILKGGQQNGIRRNQLDLSSGRTGSHDSGHRVDQHDGDRQVRETASELPVRAQSESIRSDDARRNTGTTPQRSERGSDGESSQHGGTNAAERESERGSQEHRPVEVGGNHEQPQKQRRRNRTERTDLHIKQNKKSNRAEEIPSSALSCIEMLVDCSATVYKKTYRFETYKFFSEHSEIKDRIDYLVKKHSSYGQSTSTYELVCGSKAKGVSVRFSENSDIIRVSYAQIADLIDTRIKEGSYVPDSLQEEYEEYLVKLELAKQRGDLSREIMDILQAYNSDLDKHELFNKTLNLYLLSDCTSIYSTQASKYSYIVHSTGDLILPKLRSALQTVINNNVELAYRAERALSVLNSSLSVPFEPTNEELALQLASDNNDYLLRKGDSFYIQNKRMTVAEITGDTISYFNEETPFFIEQVDKIQLLESLADDKRNRDHLNTDKYMKAEVVSLESSEVLEPDELLPDPNVQHVISDADAILDESGYEPSPNDNLWEWYQQVKVTHTDGIVFVRVGDFYETFSDEAKIMSEKLDLTLTRRTIHDDSGNVTYVSMVGFPVHALESYITRLLAQDYRIYVADRFTDDPVLYSSSELSTEKENERDSISDIPQIGSENNQDIQTKEDPPENYRITNLDLGEGTPKERYRSNVKAIETLKIIEHESRPATDDEKKILSGYVGWGGLSEAFDNYNDGWKEEYEELKELLDEKEYEAALSSVNTAFFTPPSVIDAIYSILENNGFTKGRILEPSCGIGNFFGRLPLSMSECELYGVEIDSISGRIAQILYPRAEIQIKGFEKTEYANNYFDVVIGNVPFGDFKVYDTEYKTLDYYIHDYFFAKALDKVKPGGIVAFITAQGTLDKKIPTVRKHLAQKAELVGAIRLPRGTFKEAAGTDVTADIVILQKRERAIDIDSSWVHLDRDPASDITMNSYFVDHPRMVCGEMRYVSGRFGYVARCLLSDKDDFDELLLRAVNYVQFEWQRPQLDDLLENEGSESIPADPAVHNFSFTTVDNEVYYRVGSSMYKEHFSNDQKVQVMSLIELRDCVRDLFQAQLTGASEDSIASQMKTLNELYDKYQKQFEYIDTGKTKKLFGRDDSYYLLCTLEVWSKGKYQGKSDVFRKRTIRPHETVTAVETASEALSLSLGEKAHVDIDYMTELTGKSEDDLYHDLQGTIFLNPLYLSDPECEKYLTAEDYLSDNVREKLKVAREIAETNPEFTVNVDALLERQPVDLKATEIEVRLGSTWIPAADVQAFMYELFSTPSWAKGTVAVSYNEITSEWYISKKSLDIGVKATQSYGTNRITGYAILENSLNLRDTKIYDYEFKDGKRVAVLNPDETQKAQNKQKMIEEAFVKWLWKDQDRRKRLTELYNIKFNSYRPREYDGSYLRFVGTNPEITLRKHQVDAIARIIHGGNSLLAHVVGAGKTFEMVAAAQEMKRLGLCTKSMFVVPNHIVEQFALEYYQLYPTANLLVTTKKDFETANRKKFCARIATGDYDAVIIGHSQFEKIPMSVKAQEEVLNEQLNDIRSALEAAQERLTVKQLQAQKKRVIARLEKLRDQSTKDDVVTFEELGIDRLFVDEAHYFKNLSVITKMGNVAGISTTEAKKSSDLFMKVRYLDKKTGGRGVIFATGTPVSNSMVEMYTMMKYLDYDGLKDMGLINFDAWASTFGDIVNAIELTPEGTGYRSKKRFAKFHNIPELRNMFSKFADVKTSDMLSLNVPEAVYENIVLQPSEIQKEIVKSFAERAERVRNKRVDSSEDNMLKITNDGRKLALDQRLYDEMLPASDSSKSVACADKVVEIWRETKEEKLTQLIFCDLSTPKSNGEFNIYDELRENMIKRGIPESDIAFMHSAKTEKAKQDLFKKVREGAVRILIGSTQKMGAGTNVQDKLIALHHLDCPWRPSDLQQREGRIIRQGNKNKQVYIYTYLTENTFDSYLYQIIVNKQKFISQIMTSKTPVRVAEDIDEAVLNYSEIMALASGDPRIKEKIELDRDVANLKLMETDYLEQKYILQDKLSIEFPKQLAYYTLKIEDYESDIKHLQSYSEDKEYPIVIQGVSFLDKEKAGEALSEAMGKVSSVSTGIGRYKGFDLYLRYDPFEKSYILKLKGNASYEVNLGRSATGNITRIENAIKGIPDRLKAAKNHLENVNIQINSAKEEIAKPFEKAGELQTKMARLNELNIALDLDKSSKDDRKGVEI